MSESTVTTFAPTTATWRDYAALAAELEAHRTTHLTYVAHQQSTRKALTAELSDIEQSLITQRHQLNDLHEKLDLSVPRRSNVPVTSESAATAVQGARECVEQAAEYIAFAEVLARRSPFLPYASANVRNALAYGATSMTGFVLNVMFFVMSSGSTVAQWLVLVLFVTMPFLAFGAGSSLIKALFTPALGKQPPRTRPLGMAICLAPLLPLCSLWGVFWVSGG